MIRRMGRNLVMLGPPGSGKGTQASRLTADAGIPSISTGDILRSQAAAATPLGAQVRQYLERGELVPDALVIDIIRHRLAEPDTAAGFILDGFPRTETQAEALDRMLDNVGRPIHAAIYLEIGRDALLERLGLRHRSDDRPDIVPHRIDVFLEQTAPLIDYYRRQGKLRAVDGNLTPEQVYQAIRQALEAGQLDSSAAPSPS